MPAITKGVRITRWLRHHVPRGARRRVRRAVARPRWGNLRRTQPVSDRFGFERGTPIDRYYTDAFLAAHADSVRGVVAEIAGDTYARRFEAGGVERIEIIDIHPHNPRATIVADLAEEGALPPDAFDCLIVTQTLQYVPDPASALRSCASALRAGGTLLLAAPALAAHDSNEPDEADHWRFWPAGVRRLLEAAFPDANVDVVGHGNIVAAIAFLHGLAAEELRPDELAFTDARYPVVVHARVVLP